MAKKKTDKIELTYEQKKCIICKKVYVNSMLIALQDTDLFLLCRHCAEGIREVTEFMARN